MDNKKMLETILKIREIRNNLKKLDIKDVEKEVLRKSFNYYEDLLNLDITRNNLNKSEFDSQNIPNDIEVIDVPIDVNSNKYDEFTSVDEKDIPSVVDKLCDSFDSLSLKSDEMVIVLKALKEYSEYLQELSLIQKNNQDLYNEIMNENSLKK